MSSTTGDTSWAEVAATYESTESVNDALWHRLTAVTNETPLLRSHRDWVEANRWGFGDRAFHAMWFLLLTELARGVAGQVRLLEIGVYKGQVLSLWTLIARHLGVRAQVTGISPLSGKPPILPAFHRLRMLVDRGYREDAHVGNLHEQSDFEHDVARVFGEFGMPMADVTLLKGLSQDQAIHAKVRDERFDVVYVDGGHRYEEVAEDLRLYAPLVRRGGYLVVDDAGFFLPGTAFFKGFEPVSRAAAELDDRVWANVLNVGHNRIFQNTAGAD